MMSDFLLVFITVDCVVISKKFLSPKSFKGKASGN